MPGRETELVVDGSQDGIGAILSQKNPVMKKFRPVAYTSMACTEVEKRYSQIERECLAANWSSCKKSTVSDRKQIRPYNRLSILG